MRVGGNAHLSYCTNIHPGESLAEVRRALETHVLEVKRRVSPETPFGVGLRLSERAATELTRGDACEELGAFLRSHGAYVFTLNGFPYGEFHGANGGAVKARVYEPDWREQARLVYTRTLAEVLAKLLPDDCEGSISSVPLGFRPSFRQAEAWTRAREHVVDAVAMLHEIRERTGKLVSLALEPEPACALETTEEAVRFFREQLACRDGIVALAARIRVSESAAEAALHAHFGLCLDACHAAVEFEDAKASVACLQGAGLDVKKLQISAGMRAPMLSEQAMVALEAFEDAVYLHQSVARDAQGELTRFFDLPEALAARRVGTLDEDAELRVHFHVPIFVERFGLLESTHTFLLELLALQRERGVSKHLEVETYTWDVLPSALRGAHVEDDIARELEFAKEWLTP